MKYLLFGTGEYYERYKKWFAKYDIVALLDNAPEKQDTELDGKLIMPPQDGVKLLFDAVVILSFYVKPMKKQLISLGVEESKIYHFYDLHELLKGSIMRRRQVLYGDAANILSDKSSGRTRILLLSHDMLNGGASLALYHSAKILHAKGYEIVFASMLDGPMRQTLLEEGIPVMVDENLQIETMKEAGWIADFDLVICNTLQFCVFLTERIMDIPVIWWLHDAAFFYDGIRPEVMNRISTDNLKICSVGPIPEAAVKRYLPDISVERLNYGVEDCYLSSRKRDSSDAKVRFVTIGYIEPRKGQDILVEAIKMLPGELLGCAEFYLIGQNTSLFAADIKNTVKEIAQIHICGVVGRDEIDRILNTADVMITPSREDSMPTVCAEAMMHEVACCVSDVTGTAQYIRDGVDGLIFRSEDAIQLRDRIAWCIQHRDELPGMGASARKIYEQYFSMVAHERDLMKLIGE